MIETQVISAMMQKQYEDQLTELCESQQMVSEQNKTALEMTQKTCSKWRCKWQSCAERQWAIAPVGTGTTAGKTSPKKATTKAL